ncbi:MAG TPA: hypothetical protein VMU66_02900 [Gaiellales bacterium]|nr:hypothetical protein [Gaiellales bacterium]
MRSPTIVALAWVAAGLVLAAYAAGAVVGGFRAGWYVLAAGAVLVAYGVVRLLRRP